MTDYLDVLGHCFPDAEAQVSGDQTIYENIIWKSTPIPQAELDAAICPLDTEYVIDDSLTENAEVVWTSEKVTAEITSAVANNEVSMPSLVDTDLAGLTVGDRLEWNGTKWVRSNPSSGGPGPAGMGHQISFTKGGDTKKKWLSIESNHASSNETLGIMPFKSQLVAVTYSNKRDNSTPEINFYSSPTASELTPMTLDLNWTLSQCRLGRKSNFASEIIYEAGDKVGVYMGNSTGKAENVVVTMYFIVIESNSEEAIENFNDKYDAS